MTRMIFTLAAGAVSLFLGVPSAWAEEAQSCPMQFSLLPRTEGVVAFAFEAPCAPSTGLTIFHDHYSFHLSTDPAGKAAGLMPALSSPMLAVAELEGGASVAARVDVSAARGPSGPRMVLAGQGEVDGLTLSQGAAAIGDPAGWLRSWAGEAELRLAITEGNCDQPFRARLLVVPALGDVRREDLEISAPGCALKGKILTLPLTADPAH